MSLNSIQLSAADLSHLYKNSLVEVGGENTPNNKKDNTVWKYLGENKKLTLIAVNYPEAVHIPDKQLSFLTKLLAACQLHLGDVAIFNFAKHDASAFEDILGFFTPKNVLLFAVKPDVFGLPLVFPQFQVQSFRDIKFVHSPLLEVIETDKNLKTQLWAALKKMYNL
jgi:hypothetical protein